MLSRMLTRAILLAFLLATAILPASVAPLAATADTAEPECLPADDQQAAAGR